MTGRRRTALNEALHELRRPLQALALAAAPGAASAAGLESSMRLVTAALDRLDGEINGRGQGRPRHPVSVRAVLESAVARWRSRARLAGGGLHLHWSGEDAIVSGDGVGIAQALDNLIVNSIEHGGPSILVEGRCERGRVRITVADSGRASRPDESGETPAGVLARLSGRARRGHGLRVVRRTAAVHGGRFACRYSERYSIATLELPLASVIGARDR